MEVTINITKIVKYFRENLGAPFIIFFQMLLLFCAFLLVRGYSNLANDVAIYAFYSLMIGVVLQLVSFLHHRDGVEETSDGRS
jgi:ABC-type Mn2+/Zn2+ transport system permease subunit